MSQIHPRHKSLIWNGEKGKWELRTTRGRSPHRCQAAWCRNPPYIDARVGKKMVIFPFCSKCRSRLYRANNPIRYAYEHLKDSAKKRHISFQLSYKEFEAWCISTNYAQGKGQQRLTIHCDRIRDSEGYHIDNIQTLPQGDNVRKQREREKKAKQQPTEEEDPF